MTMQQLWTPVKRELWEYKAGLLWTPAAVALLVVLFFLYMSIGHDFSGGGFNTTHIVGFDDSNSHFGAELNSQAESADFSSTIAKQFMFFIIGLITFLLWLPLGMILMVYAHSTLFDDRENSEILFWRSMPVSETQNVLTKFFVIGAVVPTLVFLLTLACVLLFLLVNIFKVFLGSTGSFADIPILFSLWLTIKIYGVVLCNLVVLFPFFAWMIFSSAAAKKSPFMFSSVVPISLLALDRMANSFFGLDLHVATAFNRYWDLLRVVGPNEGIVFSPDLILPFTIAMVLGLLLVFSTIWLRNNRYEI